MQLLALVQTCMPPSQSSGSRELCGAGISCVVPDAEGFAVPVSRRRDRRGLFVTGGWKALEVF